MTQIAVNFVDYEPYEPDPNTVACLGKISFEQVQALQEVFATATNAADSCVGDIYAEYRDVANFNSFYDHRRHCEYNLSAMFMMRHGQPLCCTSANARANTFIKKKICAKNLRTGRCTDEFMRRTLGAILFPQLYKNENEK